MKILLIYTMILLLQNSNVFAQAPKQFNYQAVARNAAGAPIANQTIKLRLSIHHGSAAGAIQYSETRSITTNAFGIFTVAIGGPGTAESSGSINSVSWQNGDKFLQVEIDPSGGNSFNDIGTTQLLSVPYALSSADNQWTATGSGIHTINAGNVGIGTASPDPSAILDLKSDSKGLLTPRLTAAQRMALASPATGLLIYQVEAPEGFYYNRGTPANPDWVQLGVNGSSGGIQSYTTAGAASYPSSTLGFVSPTLTIKVQAGQKVFLVASRAMGGYAAANELGIFPAYQSTTPGSPIVNQNLGMFGLQVPQNTRITFSVNGIFANLSPGTYKFGMSGITTSPNWTNCEWGYVSAIVF